MSPRTELRTGRERGFTLIEVVVAITLVALVAVAAVPLLIGTVRAATAAKLNTQAKNLSQQRIEQMRNMPFRIEAALGSSSNAVDLLDRYYTSVTVPGPADGVCSSRTYVPVGAVTLAGEPAPPFYRCTIDALPGYPSFRQVIATQFLTLAQAVGGTAAAPAPVAPPNTYDSQVPEKDVLVSDLLGVTVLTNWKEVGNKVHQLRNYTEITRSADARQSVSGSSQVVAVRVSSVVRTDAGPARLRLEAGVLNTEGVTYTGSTAGLSVTGAFADFGGTTSVLGRLVAAGAPPSVSLADLPAGQPGGLNNNCDLACFGSTTASNLNASVSNGLPQVGTSSNRLTSTLGSGPVGDNNINGFKFSNVPDSTTTQRLLLAGPVMLSTAPLEGNYASSSAYLESNATARTVTSSAAAKTGTIGVLPTSFAPAGVLRVQLVTASLSCTSSTATATATSTTPASAPLTVSVEYLPAGSSTYVPLSATAPLNTLPVGPTAVSALRLSDYLSAQPTRGALTFESQSSGRYGEGALKAALHVETVPTRVLPGTAAPDPDSAVSLDLGVLGCKSEDQR